MGRLGRESDGSAAETVRKRPERPWTAASTMEVLRRCPLAIAQRFVHCAIAVSTAVLDRVTKTMSVALLLTNNLDNSKQKMKRHPTCSAQLHLPTHDLLWANVRVQLHFPPLRSLDLLISPGPLRYTRRHRSIYIIQVHARRLLPSAVPWISEDRLLGHAGWGGVERIWAFPSALMRVTECQNSTWHKIKLKFSPRVSRRTRRDYVCVSFSWRSAGQSLRADGWREATLRAPLSGIFLQTLPGLVTPLKGHSLSPCPCCPATR